MNYLAHATFSFGDEEILTGNLIGDHVKGKLALAALPTGIARGIEMHRALDAFTDAHPATRRATLPFREAYGLYSGPITDALFDHFLANDPKFYPSAGALQDFTAQTYAKLSRQNAWFPAVFADYFPHMREHDWLYNYRTPAGVKRSLGGLQRRAKYIKETDTAFALFNVHYHALAQCWYDLSESVLPFAKDFMARNR